MMHVSSCIIMYSVPDTWSMYYRADTWVHVLPGRYMAPCIAGPDTWPIWGIFLGMIRSFCVCIYLGGLFAPTPIHVTCACACTCKCTCIDMSVIGYTKIHQHTSEYIWGDTYPRFGRYRTHPRSNAPRPRAGPDPRTGQTRYGRRSYS